MKLAKLGERILRRSDGGTPVTVTLFIPYVDEGGGYRCCYEIKGIGDGALRYGAGVDAIQALQIALQKIAVELHFNPEHAQFIFSDMLDSGFPLPENLK